MQDGIVTTRDNRKRVPPLRGFDPGQVVGQSILEQQVIAQDAFLQNFKTPSDIEEYHNFLRGNVFQESIGFNPYIPSGESKAVFNPEQELLKPPENGEFTPEQSAMRDMFNRLVTFKGKIPEPAFLSKIVSQSMTNGWARLLGADLVGLTRGFGVTSDGITYQGKKLKLKPKETQILSQYINRLSGADEDKDFFDTFVEVAASLTFDLPLLYLTGGIAGGVMKVGSVASVLGKSSSLMSRFLGNAVQQSINFNILGMPQTVEFASDRGIEGTLDGIYHSTGMGLLAATTGTLGAGIGRTAKFIPVAKQIANRNPALMEEVSSLGGSFGFGFASTKIAGGSDRDAIATGLAFAATHFTNPNAYKKVIREQINKDVLIRTTHYDGKDLPTKYHPDYFIEKDGKAFRINSDKFTNDGEIVPLGKEGIELTGDNRELYPYYNTEMGHIKTTFTEALIKERAERRSKDIYNDMVKDLPEEYVAKHKDMIRAFSRMVSQMVTGNELGKVFAKWKLRDTESISDKLVQISNEHALSYFDVKKFVISNIDEYMVDRDNFGKRLEAFLGETTGGYEDKVFKDLVDVLKVTENEFGKRIQIKIDEFKPGEKVKPTKPEFLDKYKFPKIEEGESAAQYKRKAFELADKKDFTIEQRIAVMKEAQNIYDKSIIKGEEDAKKADELREKGKTEQPVKTKEQEGEPIRSVPEVNRPEATPQEEVTAITNKLDAATEFLFKDNVSKEKAFNEIDDAMRVTKDNVGKERDSYIKAKQQRIAEELGYKNWEEVPETLRVYRGESDAESKPVVTERGNKYQNYTLRENVAQKFAGEEGKVYEYDVNKNDIKWITGVHLTKNEGEAIIDPSKVKPAPETKVSEGKPVIAPKLPSKGKEGKPIVEVGKEKQIEPTQSSKEIISKSEETDTLVKNVLEDKVYFQSKGAKEQINKAFDEAEIIAKELGLPVNDIMGLLLRKTGLKNPEINAVLRLGDRLRGNKEIGNIIRKYDPESSRFNKEAFNKIKNSDLLERARQTVEEKKTVEEGTKLGEELGKKTIAEKVKAEEELTKAEEKERFEAERLEEEGKVKTEPSLEEGLTRVQRIKDAEKRIEQVKKIVDDVIGDKVLTEKNFTEIVNEIKEHPQLSSVKRGTGNLNLSNFSAEDVAVQYLQNKLRRVPDEPIELFDRLSGTERTLSKSGIEKRTEKLKAELKPLGVGVRIISTPTDKTGKPAGITLISDKGINIVIDKTYASKNTFNEEKFHALTQLVDNQNQVNALLKRYGWNGKDSKNNQSWNEANEVLYDKYLAYTEGKLGKNTLFRRLKTLLKKVAAWFKGNKHYDEYKFFEDYANGNLDLITTKERYERISADKLVTEDITRLNDMLRDEPRSDKYEEKTLRALVKVDENIRKDLPRVVKTQAFLDNLGGGLLGKGERYWRFLQPPTFEKYKSNWSAKFIEMGENKLTRKSTGVYHKIMRTKWEDGEYFQGLPRETAENFVDNIKMQYTRDVYDGKTEVLSKEDFYKQYKVGESQQIIHNMYTDTKDAGIKESREGLVDNLMLFTGVKVKEGETVIDLADGLSKDKLVKLFPELVNEKGDINSADVNEILKTDINRRLEVAEEIAKEAYDFRKDIRDAEGKKIGSFDPVYFDDIRPTHPKNWVIDAVKPSENKNHKPVFEKDAEGKEVITGYLEEYKGYVDGVHDFRTKASAETEAKKIAADKKREGFTDINAYRIGDILNQSEFWNKLTPRQLRNLASAGHIALNNEIVQKLLRAIKSGTFAQHGINKRYVPGMKGTMEEYERGLNNFVREAVNSNYRQNAILEMNKLREEQYLPDINAKLTDINISAKEKEEIKTERDYINAYINNITFSDNSFIDNYRGFVSTVYTALKASFLFQQAMQPVQTTLPGLISEYKKYGFKGANGTFWKAYKNSMNLAIYVRALQKGKRPPESLGISKELEELYFFLDDAKKLGKVGIEELTTQVGDLDYAYLKGSRKFMETGKKYMNALSASVEKYTRLQGMMSFYELGKLRGLKGDKLNNYVADMIDEHLSEWGAPGRAPIFASKISGQKQASIVKAFDKSFFVFKTFATHNLGLYEKLFREKSWKALGVKATVGAGLHGLTKFPLMATIFALADIFTEDDTEVETNNLIGMLDETIGGKLGTILSRGIPGAFGFNIQNLFDERSILASDIYAETRARSAEGKLAEIMFGAPYGFGKDAVTAADTFKNLILDSIENNGALSVEYRSMALKNFTKFFPLFIRNVLIARERGVVGLKTGEQVLIKPEDMDWYELFGKAIGFQPLEVTKAYEEHFSGLPAKYSRIKGRINELVKIRRSIARAGKANYNAIEKRNELKKVAELLREAHRDRAEFLRRPEVRQAIRERKFKP